MIIAVKIYPLADHLGWGEDCWDLQ